MTALTVGLVLVLAVDAGEPDAGRFASEDPLYAMCPEAPAPEPIDGGWTMTSSRGSRFACQLVTCDERRRLLEPIAAGPPPFSSGSLLTDLLIWATGVAAGFLLGWQLRSMFFK